MTRQDIWKKANEDNNFSKLLYLRDRWQDEYEYEDINDYLIEIKKMFPEAYKIYKRRFGFTCKAEDGDIKIYFKVDGKYLKLMGEFK